MARPPLHACELGTAAPYAATARLQRALRAAREAGAIGDVLLLLEHEEVVTCGTRTEWSDVASAAALGLALEPTERGGRATWHGPGQVVAYPVLELARHGDDVKQLVRRLEQALIDTLAELGLDAERAEGWPGVWIEGRKVASLGLRVSRGITFHGVSLNVACDLDGFDSFVPCGIDGVRMTSVARELGQPETVPHPAARELVDHARELLAGAIASAFGVELQPVGRDVLERAAAGHEVADPDLRLPSPEGARLRTDRPAKTPTTETAVTA